MLSRERAAWMGSGLGPALLQTSEGKVPGILFDPGSCRITQTRRARVVQTLGEGRMRPASQGTCGLCLKLEGLEGPGDARTVLGIWGIPEQTRSCVRALAGEFSGVK